MQVAAIRSRGSGIPDDHRLDGWKAIANFLGRERTTAIRWANTRGLPVHRVPGGRTGTVYAIRAELEAWLASDRVADEPVAGEAAALPPVASPPAAPPAAPLAATPAAPPRATAWRAPVAAVIVAAVVIVLAVVARRGAPAETAVSVAAVASPAASPETIAFARSLNADLARFANASPTLAVLEAEPGTAPAPQYAVRTEIERANGRMIANARVVAVAPGQVIWSRRFEQSGPALSALREQVAATIVGVLRCSFRGLEGERSKAGPADLEQLMAICQNLFDDDLAAAQTRARRLTVARPDLALGWALLAMVQGNMVGHGDPAMQAQAVANSARAAAIAPDSLGAWLARAAASGEGPTDPRALPVIERALRVHPDEPYLLNGRSVILFNLGYVAASVAPALESIAADPGFGGRDLAVRRLAAAGRTGEALHLQADNERLWPGHPLVTANRARIAGDGPLRRAADAAEIVGLERDFAHAPHVAYALAARYERTGNRAAALAWLARAPTTNALAQWSLLFWPDAAGLRTEPAFFRKMADLGLVRWWRARRQWPDFCADPGLRYDCAAEAAALGAVRPSRA